MKTQHCLGSALIAALALLPAASRAEQDATNRVSFALRLGLNISAKFTGATGLPFPVNTRTTPDNAAYNYDNGYVFALPQVGGQIAGTENQTWNWGYDNSASQIAGSTIALSRSSPSASFASPSFGEDPNLGAELVYNRFLGRINHGKWRWGVEAAANYLNLDLHDSSAYLGAVNRLTDNYPFTPGTTPPAATPANPYQGTAGGPGFVIGDSPVSSSAAVVNAAAVTGRRSFNSDVWGFRIGPYVEIPLTKELNLSLSAGLALAVLDSDSSWAETVTLPGLGSANGSGQGSATDVQWGGYVSANLAWQFSQRWNLTGGVQYQNLGVYRHTFGGRGVEVDLSNSIFVTIGLGCNF